MERSERERASTLAQIIEARKENVKLREKEIEEFLNWLRENNPAYLERLEELSGILPEEEFEKILEQKLREWQEDPERFRSSGRPQRLSSTFKEVLHRIQKKRKKDFDAKRGGSYFRIRRMQLEAKRAAAMRTAENPGRLPGWWREIIKKKKEYDLPELSSEEELEEKVKETKEFLGWKKGDWTLGQWANRIPIKELWDYALSVTGKVCAKPNAVYLAHALDTAASLFNFAPVRKVWELVAMRAPLFCWQGKGISREQLMNLLRAIAASLAFDELASKFREFLPAPKRRDIELMQVWREEEKRRPPPSWYELRFHLA